uniref:LRAT domain-containing protein n=1 Tax=Amphimedon queenslandica TaxID=400682 RepID=A0A1X7UN82_AMPQE
MVMASPSCSCHCAKAFKGFTREELMHNITEVWKDLENFPVWNRRISWEVIMLSKGVFTHYSLLFTTPGHNEGFVIHLKVAGEHNETVFSLDKVEDISSFSTLKKTELGATEPIDAWTVIVKAHNILVSMGSYHETFNNCQDYCQKVAKELGVSRPVTGSDVAVAGAVGAGILGAAAYLLYQLGKKDDKKDDD